MATRDSEANSSNLGPIDPDLLRLIESWSGEVGQPTLRPSWGSLKQKLGESRDSVEDLYKRLERSLSPESSLLLITALTQPATAMRHQLLRQALLKLVSRPCHRGLGTLFFLPPEEIRDNLAPLVYSRGVQGQRAAYLMARLNLCLNAEAIAAILDLQIHDRSFLVNLSHLVDPPAKLTLRQKLLDGKSQTPDAQTAQIDTFADFLLDGPPGDPISPDSSPNASQAEPAPAVPPEPPPATLKPTVANRQDAVSTDESASNTSGTKQSQLETLFIRPTVSSQAPVLNAATTTEQQPGKRFVDGEMFGIPNRAFWPPFIGLSLGILLLGFFLSGSESEVVSRYKPLSSSAPAPDYWIDAVSRQRITRAFLKADSDFQMGELFANRGDFSSALKLFQDALSEYPAHLGARFREAYCLMQMHDYKGAAASFRKVLSQKADYPLANLYLGRIALVNFEPDKAADHLQKEYALRRDLRVGLEYSRLLTQLGRFPESIQVLSELQRRFPADLVISSMLTFAREQMKGK